jgi:hypothetical protein
MGKIALTWIAGNRAKEYKLEFQITRRSLLIVLLPKGGHRLHSLETPPQSVSITDGHTQSDAENCVAP